MSGAIDTIGDVVSGGVVPSIIDEVAGTDISGTIRRNVIPGTIGYLTGGPAGAAAAVGANELRRAQQKGVEESLAAGRTAAEQQQERLIGLQEQQRRQAQQQFAPFLQQSLAARQQLAQLAAAPLGQSEEFKQAQNVGLQNLRRALASQGSFFSGRLGTGAAQLNLGLLGQEQARRQQALGTLASAANLLPSAAAAQKIQPGGFTNLAQLGLLGGQQAALGQQQQANQMNQLIGLGLEYLPSLIGSSK
jgi:hypothetical protein